MLGGTPDGSPLRLALRAQLRDDPSGRLIPHSRSVNALPGSRPGTIFDRRKRVNFRPALPRWVLRHVAVLPRHRISPARIAFTTADTRSPTPSLAWTFRMW